MCEREGMTVKSLVDVGIISYIIRRARREQSNDPRVLSSHLRWDAVL